MIVIGIDIGVTGALAAIDSRGSCQVRDLPTVEIPGNRVVRRKIDARGLAALIREFVPPGEVALALYEDVHAGMGPGAAARSSLDLNRGRVESVLELARLDVRAVSPQTWKRYFGLIGKDKSDAREIAARLYPQAAHEFKRAKDHNRADAVLLAIYGQGRLA